MKPQAPPERHYRVKEVATRFGVSERTIRRRFEDRPGIKIMGEQVTTKRKRRYRTFLIPASVLLAWEKELGT